MKFVLHLGPITPKLSGYVFQTFSPAEASVSAHNQKSLKAIETDRNAIITGMLMAGGEVIEHATLDGLDQAIKETRL